METHSHTQRYIFCLHKSPRFKGETLHRLVFCELKWKGIVLFVFAFFLFALESFSSSTTSYSQWLYRVTVPKKEEKMERKKDRERERERKLEKERDKRTDRQKISRWKELTIVFRLLFSFLSLREREGERERETKGKRIKVFFNWFSFKGQTYNCACETWNFER